MKKQILLTTVVSLLGASVAFAAPVTPFSTRTGDLPAHYFSGNATTLGASITEVGSLTLALSAQTRGGATLASSGGVYSANLGESGPGLATWNFQFHINNGSLPLDQFSYRISYGTDGSGLRSFNPLLIGDNTSPFGVGNSENLGFVFGAPFNPADGLLGSAIGFNPNESADYGFLLEAFSSTDINQSSAVAKVAIVVSAGQGGPGHTVPDAGSTLALMGAAFVGIAGLRRKFNA